MEDKMELDTLSAEILQHFPELKDLKQPDLFTIAKAIRKLGRLKNKKLKESAKQEKRDQRKAERLAKQEKRNNLSVQGEEEGIAAQEKKQKEEEKRQEALREHKERITKLIEETTDEPVRAKLLGIKEKWETLNSAKLEKEKEKLLAKLHGLKSAKTKQNALDRMDNTLLKAEIVLNKKLEKRLTRLNNTLEKNHSDQLVKKKSKLEKKLGQQYQKKAPALPSFSGGKKPRRKQASALKKKEAKPRIPRQKHKTSEPIDPELKKQRKEKSKSKARNKEKQKEDDFVADSVNIYLKEIKKFKLLNREEEIKLSEEIKRGNKESLKRLVEHNLRLVVNIAKRLLHTGVKMADLIQYGNMGLMKAAERFDARAKFSTYATFWIKQAIYRKITDNEGSIIRFPVHRQDQINKLNKNRYELTKKLCRAPYDEELADYMGLTEEKFLKIKELAQSRVISLEEPLR
ncbi:MAG: sigma-70 family RNA polymerase sigma factor, partial [Patescibacteria group bacterium]